ncbi:MAG TPA: tRNA lysidine(34) synthetase TilS [Actinomycetota bacterium]|nr:tRNA lysidine(34) synthetase TilS [Actinomycetota bacterium]
MVAPRDTVLVCVSGGPDSVCLLETLVRLRRLFRMRLEVFHFDHRLRDGSSDDAGYVRRLADRLGLPFRLATAADAPSRGASVEAWATVARSNAANEVRRRIGAASMAEGHTLDDQAETVLLNVIRGGGLEAVSGIWPGSREATVIEPLLDVERSEVEAFCRALRLRPRRDPTNADARYLRNAIRHEIIPAIETVTGRDPRRPIARTADLLRDARTELYEASIRAYRLVVTDEGDEVRFDVAALRELSRPIASRVVRLAVYNALSLDDSAPWSKEGIEAILDLAAGRPGRRRDLANGSTAVRRAQYVSVSRSSPESRV